MFGSRLKRRGDRCDAVVVERVPTATSVGSSQSPATAERVWKVRLQVRPGDGRAPFEVTERMSLPPGREPWTTGTVLPAWVHPKKDQAHVELTGTQAMEAALNERLQASVITVSVPKGVTDPAEMTRLLTEQIEAQRKAQEAQAEEPPSQEVTS